MTEREALYEIMRVASYLPLHELTRNVIEGAASARLQVIAPDLEPVHIEGDRA